MTNTRHTPEAHRIISEQWDPSGLITADSDPTEAYDCWRDACINSVGGWTPADLGTLRWIDFREYIQCLRDAND